MEKRVKSKDIIKCKEATIIATAVKSNLFIIVGYESNGLLRLAKRFTAGMCGGKGKTKTAPYTQNVIMQALISFIKSNMKIEDKLNLVMKGLNTSYRSILVQYYKEIAAASSVPVTIEQRQDAKHGGTRERRARRV